MNSIVRFPGVCWRGLLYTYQMPAFSPVALYWEKSSESPTFLSFQAWLEAFSHLLSSTSGVLQGLSAQLGTTFVIYSVKKHQLVPWHLAAWLVKPTRIFMFVHVRVHVASCFNGKQCSLPERGPTLQHPVELVHRSITLLCLSQEVFFSLFSFFFYVTNPFCYPVSLVYFDIPNCRYDWTNISGRLQEVMTTLFTLLIISVLWRHANASLSSQGLGDMRGAFF